MPKILVIPDAHLKPYIYDDADDFLQQGKADFAVSLMDIPDDWGNQYNLDLYQYMFDRVLNFQRIHPESLWCWGNHECAYLWKKTDEAGYSFSAAGLVNMRLHELVSSISEGKMAFVHRIDCLIFSHAGLTASFVFENVPEEKQTDIDDMITYINTELSPDVLWTRDSPLWARPQDEEIKLWMSDRYIQVVGHTPVNEVRLLSNGVISTDVFSRTRSGHPIGNEKMIVIDSETGVWNYTEK